MSEEKREVNIQEFDDDGNETIVSAEDAQSLEKDPETSPGVEEGVKQEESEEKEDVETPAEEPEETNTDEPLEPKPVEGETLRERALRKEIERLREKNRDILKSSVVSKAKNTQQSQDIDISELLAEGYTEQDIESSKKLIATLAPAMGFVNKQQTYQDIANQELDKFIEDHPEYLPKNDKDDLRWGKFIEIIGSDYNLSNKSPKQLKAIYEKVDRDVRDEFGDIKVTNNENKVKAQVQKIQSVSHAGGNKSIPTQTKSNKGPIEVDGIKFDGFDKEDLL